MEAEAEAHQWWLISAMLGVVRYGGRGQGLW